MKAVILGDNETISFAIAEILKDNYPDVFSVNYIGKEITPSDLQCLHNSNIIIIDFTTTKNNNRILISEIKEIVPEGKIIILNIYDQHALIKPMIEAGASAYLHIDFLHKNLVSAIGQVLNGSTFIGVD